MARNPILAAFAALLAYFAVKPKPKPGAVAPTAPKPDEPPEARIDSGNVERGSRLIESSGPAAPIPDVQLPADKRSPFFTWSWQHRFDRDIWQTISDRYRLVPPVLAKAIAYQESSFDPSALRLEPKINDESVGLFQLLTETARWVVPMRGTKEEIRARLLDPKQNIPAGLKYLTYQIGRYGSPSNPDNLRKIIAAYNAGSAIRSKTDPTKFINEGYVTRVLSHMDRFKGDFPPIEGR